MDDGNSKNQILWFEVDEKSKLRELHNKLNNELFKEFGIEKNKFDGICGNFIHQ